MLAIMAPRFWYGCSAAGADQISDQLVVLVWLAPIKFWFSAGPQLLAASHPLLTSLSVHQNFWPGSTAVVAGCHVTLLPCCPIA